MRRGSAVQRHRSCAPAERSSMRPSLTVHAGFATKLSPRVHSFAWKTEGNEGDEGTAKKLVASRCSALPSNEEEEGSESIASSRPPIDANV